MRIITTAQGTARLGKKSQMEILDWALNKSRSLASEKPDIIVFPEVFLKCGGDFAEDSWKENTQKTVEAFQTLAKEMRCCFLFSAYEPHEWADGYRYNTTWFIARDGSIGGRYRKAHTTEGETASKVLPGPGPVVLNTEFGKIGIATCYDIGWRDMWTEMGKMGAQVVFWTAAYEGGNLLDAYAIENMYWVVSCVRTYRARVIDPLGRTVAETGYWDDVAIADIDPDIEIFHIDRNYWRKINDIRSRLGDKVQILARSEENSFTISSRDPEWPISRIKAEFGMVSYKEYHAEADAMQRELRSKYGVEYRDQNT